MEKFGSIRIKLDQLIEQSDISKTKLCQRAELQHSQLNRYCNNTVTRLDTDVLARICKVMNCQISDLLEFVPPEDK